MKKKIALVGMVLLTVLATMSGCGKKTTEYFNYVIHQVSGEKYIQIMELTDLGNEQEYIIIPGEIGGIKVKQLGGIAYHGAWKSEKLKKVYVNCYSELRTSEYFFQICPNLRKIILLYSTTAYKDPDHSIYAINSKEEVKYGNRANLSFRYNYSEAPNEGFYWIDDLDDEKIEVIPADPTRQGYRFGGWYKESECINKWDFDTDIVPAKEHDEEEKYIYKETCLYAKWDVE